MRDDPLPGFVLFEDDGETRVRDGGGSRRFTGAPAAAIQWAIDAGSEDGGAIVVLAPGTYECRTGIGLSGSIWLRGCGNATTIRSAPELNEDVITIPPEADHARLSDLTVDGNRRRNDYGDCIAVRGGTWRPIIENVTVRAGPANGVRFGAGPGNEYTFEPVLTNVDAARCGGDGFVFGYTGDLFGANLYAESCDRYGFTLADAGGTIIHPHAYDSAGEAGLRILDSGRDLSLLAPHFEGNERHGAIVRGRRVDIRSGTIRNNSRRQGDAHSGLVLDGARDCSITGTTFGNYGTATPTQRHGLLQIDASGCRVTNCRFSGHTSAPVIRRNGGGSVYRDNFGYRTEGGGTAVVADGDRIPHGLDEKPRRQFVQSTTPGVYAHVVAIDGNALTVEAMRIGDGRSAASDVAVSWYARA